MGVPAAVGVELRQCCSSSVTSAEIWAPEKVCGIFLLLFWELEMKCLAQSGDWESSSWAGLGFFTLLLLCAGCLLQHLCSVRLGCAQVLLCCGPAYPEQSWAETTLCCVAASADISPGSVRHLKNTK